MCLLFSIWVLDKAIDLSLCSSSSSSSALAVEPATLLGEPTRMTILGHSRRCWNGWLVDEGLEWPSQIRWTN